MAEPQKLKILSHIYVILQPVSFVRLSSSKLPAHAIEGDTTRQEHPDRSQVINLHPISKQECHVDLTRHGSAPDPMEFDGATTILVF